MKRIPCSDGQQEQYRERGNETCDTKNMVKLDTAKQLGQALKPKNSSIVRKFSSCFDSRENIVTYVECQKPHYIVIKDSEARTMNEISCQKVTATFS